MTTPNLLGGVTNGLRRALLWPAFEEHFLKTGDGTRLFLRIARTFSAPRGVVVITHGLGEHSGRYAHVAAALLEKGLTVVGWDLRGHGRSSGPRGDIAEYGVLLADLALVCAHYRMTGRPLFLYAHSMGAQVALRFLEEAHPNCAGAVIASPWLRLAFDPPWWKLALAWIALRVRPGFIQQTGTRLERLSRDLRHLESLPGLELVHHNISARMYFAVRAAGEQALQEAGKLRVPLLLLHGDDDPITSHHATRELFDRAGVADKTLQILPQSRHETHNDLDRDLVIRAIGDWIAARMPSES